MLTHIDIDLRTFGTVRFEDFQGNRLEVLFDDTIGNVIELKHFDHAGKFVTVVKRQSDSFLPRWHAYRVTSQELRDDHEEQVIETGNFIIPPFTRFLSDVRFNSQDGELTLASDTRSRRWVFHTNGSLEFYSEAGHLQISRNGH